jgi:large subunit ribosomal protein L14
MIQKGSYLKVADNCGAKIACCIHVYGGYKKRYAKTGDSILVSVKKIRNRRKKYSKVKKGEITKAFVLGTKKEKKFYDGFKISFSNNFVVLLNKKGKLMGTRLFIPLARSLRTTKLVKLLSVSCGVLN